MKTAASSSQKIPLDAPVRDGKLSLEAALARRRSVREFTSRPLTRAELGQLLWAAQGITHPDGLRTAPSAGALYPLELYVVTPDGLFHYLPREHALEPCLAGDLRQPLARAALDQECVRDAAAVFVFAAIFARIAAKYGAERAPRYTFMEAGHAAQNLHLECVALGLGSVAVGAFHDREVHRLLALPPTEEPIYMVAVGHPRSGTSSG